MRFVIALYFNIIVDHQKKRLKLYIFAENITFLCQKEWHSTSAFSDNMSHYMTVKGSQIFHKG